MPERDDPKDPLYNKNSKKWVATVVQKIEIVVIRQNNKHGFISLGWDHHDEKIVVGILDDYDYYLTKKQKTYLKKKCLFMAKEMAIVMNKWDKLT